MAYVKINGDVKEVDDDELRALIGAGGEEVDAPSQPSAQSGSGYQYNSPEDYEDLKYTAAKVGYSRLNQDQKDLFDQGFPYSRAARTMTLQQARDATDEGKTGTPFDLVGSAIRHVTGVPVAGLAAGISGLQAGLQYDPNTNPEASRWLAAKDAALLEAPVAYKNAVEGKGLEGTFADPVNLAALILPEGKIPGLVAAKWGENAGRVARVAGEGATNAGLAATSMALNPSENVNPVSVGLAAGIGAVPGAIPLIGAPLQSAGVRLFPNYVSYRNHLGQRLGNDKAESAIDENIRGLYDANPGLVTQSSLLKTNQKNLDEAGQGMDDALNSRIGDLYPASQGTIPLSNVPQPTESFVAPNLTRGLGIMGPAYRLAYSRQGQYAKGIYPGSGVPGAVALRPDYLNDETTVSDLGQRALDIYHRKQANRATSPNMEEVEAAITRRVNDIGKRIKLRGPGEQKLQWKTGDPVLDPATGQPTTYPGLAAGKMSVGAYNPVTGKVDPVPLPAIRSVKDLADQRHAVRLQYKPTSNPERVGVEADDAVHEAISSRLNEIPGYEEAAAPYSKQYAIARGLTPYIQGEAPNPRGLARQIPAMFNTYWGPGDLYKLGGIIKGLNIPSWAGTQRVTRVLGAEIPNIEDQW